jgi:hypothetical protein
LPAVMVDANQIELAVLNLAVNAGAPTFQVGSLRSSLPAMR